MSSYTNIAYLVLSQAAAGYTLGSLVNFLFGKVDTLVQKDIALNKETVFPMLVGELSLQLIIDGWLANYFFEYMANRGMELGRTLTGNAVFWVTFLGSQPLVASKATALIYMIENLLNNVTTSKATSTTSSRPITTSSVRGGGGPSATGQRTTPTSVENNTAYYPKTVQANNYSMLNYSE